MGTRSEGSLYPRPRCEPSQRHLPRRVQNRCPRCPRHRLPQARMRLDLSELEPGEEEVVQLRILLERRRDLVIDQNRIITRLGEALVLLSPALERALDLNRRGSLTLLTHYQSSAQLRRAGHKRIAAYLR